MTPETDNAIRAACRRCTEEIQQAMRKKPKPNWNETVPPIINKHHKKIEALGVSLLEFVVKTGRLNGVRFTLTSTVGPSSFTAAHHR